MTPTAKLLFELLAQLPALIESTSININDQATDSTTQTYSVNKIKELIAASFDPDMLDGFLRVDTAMQGLSPQEQLNGQTNLALVPGTNVQAYDADLAAIAGLVTQAFGRGLLTGQDAPAVRAMLLLGTSALANTGTSAGNVPVLDGNGKIVTGVLPEAILGAMKYQGTWNASTNTPTLASPPASSTKGFYYVVSVAGSTNLSGITDWKVGDWAVSNGSTWDKVDSSDQVNSVAGLQGTITDANLRTALGLIIGQTVQAWDADLDAIAALTGNSKLLFRNASGQWVVRGLGTGLTDDGTNIVASGGANLPPPQTAYGSDVGGTAVASGFIENRTGATRTYTIYVRSDPPNTASLVQKSTAASPDSYTTTVFNSATPGSVANVTLENGALFRVKPNGAIGTSILTVVATG